VNVSSWGVPPVFEYLLGFADVEKNERYRTFNMGIGFVVILPESEVVNATNVLEEVGETVHRIGHIHKREGESVTLIG